MKTKKYLLFDLDGTVADSGAGVFHSAIHAMNTMGVTPPDMDTMAKFLGPPLRYSFITYAGISEDKVDEAIRLYRENYAVEGVYKSTLFDGAREFFAAAEAAGKKMYIASAKPLPFVETVLDFLGIRRFFSGVSAADFKVAHLSKAEIVARAIAMTGADKSECLMIGDRCFDVEGAHDNGIDCVGIVNSSPFREELWQSGAINVANDFFELYNFLL